jgi:hypothetical protein
MQALGRGTIALCAALALTLLATARPAPALTLDALAAGGTIETGVLTFSNFEVTIGGDLPSVLGDYPVQVLEDGFRLAGPLSVLLGDGGTLLLSYDVTVSHPGGVIGAQLFADGETIGDGAQAFVAESLFGPGNTPLGSLFVYAVAGVGEETLDQIALGGPTHLHVVKTITIRSGTFSAIPFVDQRFVAVAEPFSLALMASGLAGLALLGRRSA